MHGDVFLVVTLQSSAFKAFFHCAVLNSARTKRPFALFKCIRLLKRTEKATGHGTVPELTLEVRERDALGRSHDSRKASE